MTFTQLEIFSVLAVMGSFSRAADALGITQSGVSHAIKQLEIELDISLLDRSGSTITLTDVGRRLLTRGNDILQQQAALLQEANLERGIARGTLKIASFGASSSLQLLPPLMAHFKTAHPYVELHIEEASDTVVVKWLLERRVELGFVVLPDKRFETLPLVLDEMVAVLPTSHRLATKNALVAEDFHDELFIQTRAGSGPYIDSYFSSEGVVPKTVYRFEQLTSMMGFVAQGAAITIAARLALPEAPPGVVYRSLKPRWHREIALAALSFDKLSPAARAFVEIARASRKRAAYDDL